MKKDYILLLLIIGFPQFSHAQWKVSGGLTFTNYSTNIQIKNNHQGIETTKALEIKGFAW